MSGPGKTPRLVWIDGLKGLLILLVVLGHIADGYRHSGLFDGQDAALRGLFNAIYAFHMPLFMTVSGYLYRAAYVAPDGTPDRRRVLRRTLDMAAVYVLFSLLFGLTKLCMSGLTNHDVTARDLLLIPVKAIDVYWYLYVLICQYLLFCWKRLHTASPALLLPLFLALAVLSGYLPRHMLFELSKNLNYALFFYLGLCLRAERPKLPGWAFYPLLAPAVWLCVRYWRADLYLYVTPLVGLVIALGLTLAAWRSFPRSYQGRFLRFLGGFTLEIYVTHCVLTAGNRALLPRLGVTALCPAVALNLVLSTAIPVLGALALERLGLRKLLFRPVTYWIGRRKNSL